MSQKKGRLPRARRTQLPVHLESLGVAGKGEAPTSAISLSSGTENPATVNSRTYLQQVVTNIKVYTWGTRQTDPLWHRRGPPFPLPRNSQLSLLRLKVDRLEASPGFTPPCLPQRQPLQCTQPRGARHLQRPQQERPPPRPETPPLPKPLLPRCVPDLQLHCFATNVYHLRSKFYPNRVV